MTHRWTDIEYLSQGNSTQQNVYRLLKKHQIMVHLQPYCPILVGTIPIDIHVSGSDLDILCEVHDFNRFEQNGYRHMVIEARLLQLFGDKLKNKIIALKSEGIKTEPAFAKELRLEGDPYQALLKLYPCSDEELIKLT